MSDKICVVVGVGPGNGMAFAKRFAQGGYRVALLSRDLEKLRQYEAELPNSRAVACDAGDPVSVSKAFSMVAREMGHVDTLIYNAGSGSWSTIEETTATQMEQAWRVNTLGLMSAAQAVIPGMKEKGAGSILISGATASLRGGGKMVAFASAKAAQRSLAQSMARHLGPQGIHVALAIIDGMIDLTPSRKLKPDAPDDFFLKPDEIADSYWNIAHQPKSAWTFEFDLRPYGEKW